MAIGSILSNALSALQTNQAALNTTSANIANINTPGYKRRVVEQEAVQFGNTPGGVAISEIRRVAATFLARESLNVTSEAARFGAESKVHDSLQGFLGRPDQNTSLSGRLDRVFATLGDLSLDPRSVIRRSTLLTDVGNLADTISSLAEEIQSLRTNTDNEIKSTTEAINEALRQIDSLNPRIQRETVSGGDAAGLRDQRDQAVMKLAELMDIRVAEQPNGKLYVMTQDGVPLVTEQLYQLDYTQPGPATAGTSYPPVMIRRVDPNTGGLVPQGTALEPHLGSGALRGLLDMRSKTLPDLAKQVGEFAAQVTNELNAAHNQSTASPPPAQLTGRNTGLLASDAHGFTGRTSFVVLDADGDLVTRVDVDFSTNSLSVNGGASVGFGGATLGDAVSAINTALGGSGSVALNNGILTLQANGAGNGIAIVDDATTPAQRAGRGFSHVFGLNDLVTASRPSSYDTGLQASDNHGFTPGQTFNIVLRGPNGEVAIDYTHTIAAGTLGGLVSALNASGTGLGGFVTFALDANGRLSASPTAAFAGYRIEVVDDQTTRGGTNQTFTGLFGIGESAQAEQAQGMALTAALKDNPNRLAVSRITLPPTAVPGDPVLGSGDNRGVLALQAVQDKTATFRTAGGIGALNTTLGDYAATILANAGQRAARSDSLKEENEALKSDLHQRTEAIQGVNLDEELANMTLYQQSYNAAARLVTTANELFDELLKVV